MRAVALIALLALPLLAGAVDPMTETARQADAMIRRDWCLAADDPDTTSIWTFRLLAHDPKRVGEWPWASRAACERVRAVVVEALVRIGSDVSVTECR